MNLKIILIAFCFPIGLYAQPKATSLPNTHKAFLEFKTTLNQAIADRDTQLLKSLFYKRVLTNFDAFDCSGGCTPIEVINLYFSENENGIWWKELEEIVKQGYCTTIDSYNYTWITDNRDSMVYIAPCYIKQLNMALQQGDPKIYVLVDKLNVRQKPSTKAKVMSQISKGLYNTETDEIGNTQIITSTNGVEWVKVYLENGVTGFISSQYTSESISRELGVANFNGDWRIIRFEPSNPTY